MRSVSHADPSQIVQREFDEELDAKRVVIVGGVLPTFEVKGNPASQQEVRIERIEVPQIIVQEKVQVIEVEKVIVQKELQIERVEIPVVVREVQEVIREVPVIQHEVKFIEIPVVVKEVQYREMSNLVKVCLVVHSLVTTLLLLKFCLK